MLVVVMLLRCLSYHGLGVWFPDMIKYMQYEEYESKVRVFHRERVERFHFNFSLVNQIHKEGEYIHDKWVSSAPAPCCSLFTARVPALAVSRVTACFLPVKVCKY